MTFEPSTDPVYWSVKNIVSLGHEVIHELAKRSSATVNSYQLVVGRCLLAVEQSKLYEVKGYSGAIHYAVRVLGLGRTKARELRRVARQLEALPKLSTAAELGQVSWGKLRAIVSKATLETEDFWLGVSSLKTCNEVEYLVAATEHGQVPWDSSGPTKPDTRYQLNLDAEAGELFERVIQMVSQDVGKPMNANEVVEHLAIEKLAKRPIKPAVIEAARREARRGCAAAKRRHSLLIKEARELAYECGLIEAEDEDPLTVALGTDSLPGAQDELSLRSDQGEKVCIEILEVRDDVGGSDGRDGPKHGESLAVMADGSGWDVQDGGETRGVSGAVDPSSVKGPGSAGKAGHPGRGPYPAESGGPRCELVEKSMPVLADPPDWGALIVRALKEKKFVIDLESDDDWKNKHVSFNPEARFVTPAQRRELLRRDGYCCSNPGCPNHLWLEIHHVVAVSRKGKTSSFNLVALCSRCHRNVHRGFLKISGDADRGLVFRDAEGNDLERAHVLRVANWLNLFLGWEGGRDDFHRPGPLAAA